MTVRAIPRVHDGTFIGTNARTVVDLPAVIAALRDLLLARKVA